MQRGLVGSEMCIRDRRRVHGPKQKMRDIVALYEDEKFFERQMALIVDANVYYHKEQNDKTLRLALDQGFDIEKRSGLVEPLISIVLIAIFPLPMKLFLKNEKKT
eukprot:TRINITY_DN68367_c0_g1_i1.p3 TRINITY_DN68367_c0_g1~~TRINITY_DN68367_c0_g1_i1.p3  ORF type:complete len:105 (+),score=23.68 TRINITY_DN68367_c0_g1_i1:160-474(+)